MKYYNLKLERFKAEPSKVNPFVGTWIGIISTFSFLLIAAKMGGFKGSMDTGGIVVLCYIGMIWFINYLAQEYSLAKYILWRISAFASIVAFLTMISFYVLNKDLLLYSTCLFVLNLGICCIGSFGSGMLNGEGVEYKKDEG